MMPLVRDFTRSRRADRDGDRAGRTPEEGFVGGGAGGGPLAAGASAGAASAAGAGSGPAVPASPFVSSAAGAPVVGEALFASWPRIASSPNQSRMSDSRTAVWKPR